MVMRLEKVVQPLIPWLKRWKKEDLYSDYKTKLGSTRISRLNTSEYKSSILSYSDEDYPWTKNDYLVEMCVSLLKKFEIFLWKWCLLKLSTIFISIKVTKWVLSQRLKCPRGNIHLSPCIEEVQILKRYLVMLKGQKSVSSLWDWNNIWT